MAKKKGFLDKLKGKFSKKETSADDTAEFDSEDGSQEQHEEEFQDELYIPVEHEEVKAAKAAAGEDDDDAATIVQSRPDFSQMGDDQDDDESDEDDAATVVQKRPDFSQMEADDDSDDAATIVQQKPDFSQLEPDEDDGDDAATIVQTRPDFSKMDADIVEEESSLDDDDAATVVQERPDFSSLERGPEVPTFEESSQDVDSEDEDAATIVQSRPDFSQSEPEEPEEEEDGDDAATIVQSRPNFSEKSDETEYEDIEEDGDDAATIVQTRPDFSDSTDSMIPEIPVEEMDTDFDGEYGESEQELSQEYEEPEEYDPRTPDEIPLSELASDLSKGEKTKEFLKESTQKISGIFKTKDSAPAFFHKLSLKGKNLLDKNLWNKLLDDIFSAANRPQIHRTFVFLVLLATSYTAGKVLGLLLQPDTKSGKSSNVSGFGNVKFGNEIANDIGTIKQANLFNAKETHVVAEKPKQQVKKIDKNLVCHQSSKTSTLPIKLLNTIVLQDTVKSLASVQKRGQKDPLSVREGDKIDNMAEIGRINRLNMVIKNLNSGECEFVQNQDEKFEKKHQDKNLTVVSPSEGKKLISETKPTGIINEGDNFKIKKSYRDKVLGNMSEILTQARAIPIRNSDGTYSFKLEDIVKGSVYSHLNLQNGDIIKGINGKKIANMNEVMSMFGKIKSIDNLSLTVIRSGAEKTMDYEFE